MNRTEFGYASTEQELQAERAAVLGRLGSGLEAVLHQLACLRRELQAQAAGERQAWRAAHEALVAEARLRRWYLEVQREAIGVHDHRLLDVLYPLPPLPPRIFEQDT
jgi:hypothetical protein